MLAITRLNASFPLDIIVENCKTPPQKSHLLNVLQFLTKRNLFLTQTFRYLFCKLKHEFYMPSYVIVVTYEVMKLL
jgi:hypothetical protein